MQLGVEERLCRRASDSAHDGLLCVRCTVHREEHPGQMSAAVCELLARGVPVISDMTTHGEARGSSCHRQRPQCCRRRS